MRVATRADYAKIERIAHDTLKVAYPTTFVPAGDGLVGGFQEKLAAKGVLVCVTDDLSAFILTERNGDWKVAWVMPHNIPAQTGKDLMAFAMQEEHKLRPFLPTTRCYSELSKESNLERATADAYTLMLTATRSEDARKIVNELQASVLATKIGAKIG